ncbi:uncharacterized protein ANIA_11586 [Aspergillus nidulans FGSC A4]|uniref:Uncharacterized protein n=1 Tax=Emericella nidulans (strain FGSC A4 / ATCC 38163 / CBS 112.46 / NRRL 194 / M139) TaxID=227321 RepID=C8V5F8_EMENI|nr:hypothetical protein [Aspergillus nidulans FGSC A4]CBF73641.1 TPA: hypothetical protein ANIA_11586 [Aspergillus nidulans FGSC A4]
MYRQEPRCFLQQTADIGEELMASLLEEYANQKKPTNREIYHKIRQYKGEGLQSATVNSWPLAKWDANQHASLVDHHWLY